MALIGPNVWRAKLRKSSRAIAKECLKLTGNNILEARMVMMNAVEALHEIEKSMIKEKDNGKKVSVPTNTR